LATEASEQVATRFVAAIEAHFEPLRHSPLAGPSREQLASGLRVTFHSPYAIYYRPQPDALNRAEFPGGSNFQVGWSHDEQNDEQIQP
jgi:plasmid stabilization system protein ParE